MYEFIRGPLVWLAFTVLIGGSIWRIAKLIVDARKEKVVLPTMSAKHGLRSVMHWLIPFANRNTRLRPVFTIISFTFHICLLVTPLFAMGHAVLWEQSWGIRWWSLPPVLVDVMTVLVVLAGVFFMLRRIAAPEVRNVTDWTDYALVLLVISPFASGFAAHMQWLPVELGQTLHILLGCLWLMLLPFTRLAHMLFFFFTRAFMGSEFGEVRHSRDW